MIWATPVRGAQPDPEIRRQGRRRPAEGNDDLQLCRSRRDRALRRADRGTAPDLGRWRGARPFGPSRTAFTAAMRPDAGPVDRGEAGGGQAPPIAASPMSSSRAFPWRASATASRRSPASPVPGRRARGQDPRGGRSFRAPASTGSYPLPVRETIRPDRTGWSIVPCISRCQRLRGVHRRAAGLCPISNARRSWSLVRDRSSRKPLQGEAGRRGGRAPGVRDMAGRRCRAGRRPSRQPVRRGAGLRRHAERPGRRPRHKGSQGARSQGHALPVLLMDVPADNGLPDPMAARRRPPILAGTDDGGGRRRPDGGRPRGYRRLRRNGGPRTTSRSARSRPLGGPAGEWSLRRMVLHQAHLRALAGGVDAFVIASEMRA